MDLFRQGMKGPTRPAPAVPGLAVNRYSPVTNWDNDPFGADVFEPMPHVQKKKPPPPRPPPPKINMRQPDVPVKPSHFIRRPTVLTSLLSRRNKQSSNQSVTQQHVIPEFTSVTSDMDTKFAKCEPKNVQTGALIDLSSPPSSPTFTTRSSSDGLSVDSFGSDATTSTNHHNTQNGNASQAESGFEDDFDLFLNSRKSREEIADDFTAIDPFSPQTSVTKPPVLKKSSLFKDPFDMSNISLPQVPTSKGPTIIRAKPARPKPPDSAAILKNTFGDSFPMTTMSVNTTTPIQKVNSFGESFESKPFSWDEESSPERESSPPMPTIPPPPPPVVEEEAILGWSSDVVDAAVPIVSDDDEPCAIALFDYHTDHPDDLCFSANTKIKLIRRVDNEWLFGSLRNGVQGLFPLNYVEIKVPLPNESMPAQPLMGSAVALYDFEPDQPGDLRFLTGDTILVRYKLNDEWYFGECNGAKGQFPINYVKMS